MDYPYNLTMLKGSTNLFTFVDEINNLTAGLFGIFIILSVFIILFVTFKAQQYPTKESLAATTFITTILALILRAVGFVPDYVLYICIVLTLISFYLLYIKQD